MRIKFICIALVLLLSIFVIPTNSDASYILGISGGSDFVVPPYQDEVLNNANTYARIYLSETSQSSLEVEIKAEGEIGPYITFPDFNGTPVFTIYPDEDILVRYIIDFPSSSPGKYTGSIIAIGNPPSGQVSDEGAVVVTKPVVSINLIVDVPTDVQIYNLGSSNLIGFPDGQWTTWGTGWRTSLDVINGGDENFTGYCNVTISNSTSVLEYENYLITDLAIGGTDPHTTVWNTNLPLSATYSVQARLYSNTSQQFDDETASFYLPSPADIISVEHSPDVVYSDDTVSVYAVLASSDSSVTLHYQVNNGAEYTDTMTYSVTTGEFVATIPPQAIGSTVDYWVTSANTVYTDRSPDSGTYSYYVFSPDIPDLVIDASSIGFAPVDPTTTQMNQSETGTNIIITVRNIGRGVAQNVLVRVFDNEVPIANLTITSIAGDGNSDTTNYNWIPLEGTHNLRFDVDPDNAIPETDEDNNDYTMQVTIYGPTPVTPTEPPGSILPYIIIPVVAIVALLLLLLMLRRKSRINVQVRKVRPFKSASEGDIKYRYHCGYSVDKSLGNTSPTTIKAAEGDIIQVEPTGLTERSDGRIIWQTAKVIKLQMDQDDPDPVEKIRKQIKKKER